MDRKYYDAIEGNPVVAAVKDMEGLRICCRLEDIKVVFILFGDICSIGEIVSQVKETGRMAMVHVDLIAGLNSKEVAVDFIKKNTQADGIISTKPSLIRRGRELSLCTVLRYFLIDSMALESIRQQQSIVKPDFIEVLPGLMPKVIQKICRTSRTPIIAGGLITDKEAVMGALNAGAIAVSTTHQDVWRM
ncbi:MAG: glycerol-3-phosphate responsive antiterminator [Dorea sp.]|jgi:glycerol uptake operon antiterminator|uniref:glycerol-3-phosphate responsive antiterminator n=1 Tax=Sporofaciens sp. JLR.KK001 TaxID=3112621 RepID=UPI00217188E3|nr:glycerol-3-phosphate responsive antiterminator [Dorea sp.]